MTVHQDRITGELLASPEMERDVFVIGPLYEPASGIGGSTIQGSFSARMVEALNNYPPDVRVVAIAPAITATSIGLDWGDPAHVAALFTVTVEWEAGR